MSDVTFKDAQDQFSKIADAASGIDGDLEKAEKGVKKARTRIRGNLMVIIKASKEARRVLTLLNRK